MAAIEYRLDARPLSDLEGLDSLSNFDNDAGTFVARTTRPESRHRRENPVRLHEVDIGQTETGCVELDENIFGT